MKNSAVPPMPFWTPARRMARVRTQTITRMTVIIGTKSIPNPLPAWRKSSEKKVAVSS